MKRHGEGYRRKLARLIAEGKITLPLGSMSLGYVAHHHDCPFLAGGRCRCDPDIDVATREPAA